MGSALDVVGYVLLGLAGCFIVVCGVVGARRGSSGTRAHGQPNVRPVARPRNDDGADGRTDHVAHGGTDHGADGGTDHGHDYHSDGGPARPGASGHAGGRGAGGAVPPGGSAVRAVPSPLIHPIHADGSRLPADLPDFPDPYLGDRDRATRRGL